MEIYVADEHFTQCWLVFKKDPWRNSLLELSSNSVTYCMIYTYENEDGDRYPAIEVKAFKSNQLGELNDSWYDRPCIRFSTRGIKLEDFKRNNSSLLDGKDGFFNAEITLHNLTRDAAYYINMNELILYAKYRWCQDMGLKYLYEEEAQDIERRLEGYFVSEEFEIEYRRLLGQLNRMNYSDYLKTEHWKHFREEAILFYQSKCQLCGQIEDKKYNLHLHHNSYENLGRETFNDVVLLCKDCHQKHHKK